MRENRPYGSEGGVAKAIPTPIAPLRAPALMTSGRDEGMALPGPNQRIGTGRTRRTRPMPSSEGPASRFPFPHIVERSGSGSGKSPATGRWSLAPVGGRDPSRGQPITLAVFHDATVRDERGKPFVEGCVAHAALGPEVGEGPGGPAPRLLAQVRSSWVSARERRDAQLST